jgi:uncharacterized protein YaaW (UPF0174 family)
VAYKTLCPDHQKYVDEIAAEIQKFGGNTIANIMRGGRGVLYKEIARDVAGKIGADYGEGQSVDLIEQQILLKVLEKSWKKMTETEKKAFLKGMRAELHSDRLPKAFPIELVQAALIAGGAYASYRGWILLANAIARTTLGRELSVIAGSVFRRWINALGGAVAGGLTAIWALLEVAGPAYRVTAPCVIHIAMLRQLDRLKQERSGLNPKATGANEASRVFSDE